MSSVNAQWYICTCIKQSDKEWIRAHRCQSSADRICQCLLEGSGVSGTKTASASMRSRHGLSLVCRCTEQRPLLCRQDVGAPLCPDTLHSLLARRAGWAKPRELASLGALIFSGHVPLRMPLACPWLQDLYVAMSILPML